MILYIIRFSLSLGILYAFYKVFLEKEKGYTFNRYYLLSGIIISMIIPLISMGGSEPIKNFIGQSQPGIEHSLLPWETWITYTYLAITFVLSVRFTHDVSALFRKIRSAERRVFDRATIILTEEPTPPYSFLNYVFIHKDQFEHIQPELLRHELTHVQQWHTLDVFLIELVKIFFWINPLLSGYKKAMQLNHEFLADHHVITEHQNVKRYQEILLSYLSKPRPITVTSGLNFSLTKKRFSMMTKKKNKTLLIKQLLVIPVFVLIILACSDNKGVTGKEMLHYWRYTANMEEILKTGTMNEEDLKEGVIKPIENSEQYDQLIDIYSRMNKTQKESVYKLPPYLEPVESN